jgi:hypothetical protein
MSDWLMWAGVVLLILGSLKRATTWGKPVRLVGIGTLLAYSIFFGRGAVQSFKDGFNSVARDSSAGR